MIQPTLNLIRYENSVDQLGIQGTLQLMYKGKEHLTLNTLENIKYLLNDGNYTLIYEYSPKFNKNLWELYGTDGRTEIKFHQGNQPNHSRGCIILSNNDMVQLEEGLDKEKIHRIKIRTI